MIELISTYGIGSVIIILLVGIPAIVNFITWCKNLWNKRQAFQNENIQRGRQQEAAEEADENRLQNGEKRIQLLEDNLKTLTNVVKALERRAERHEKSDRLAIKTWIKEQHEKWVKLGCIDNYTLDLLEERYAIYKEEGGNSWAEKLMNELRALPTITVIAVSDKHDKK